MAIPFYAGIALGQIGRRLECRHGLCRPYINIRFIKSLCIFYSNCIDLAICQKGKQEIEYVVSLVLWQILKFNIPKNMTISNQIKLN